MLDAGDRSAALEATSHGSELGRLDGIRFASLAFTNLTQDHLDFHGTMEHYFEAKRRLFVDGRAAGRDQRRRPVGPQAGAKTRPGALTFGFADDAEIRPDALEGDRAGGSSGRFNVENVLAAVAVALLLDIDDEAIARGLEALDGVPGRFETVEEGQPFTVVVDYSHKPGCARERAAHRARPRRRPRDLRLRLRRRPRPREAPADGPDRRRARRRRRSSPPTTPAARTRARSSRRSSRAWTATSRSSRTAVPRSRARSRPQSPATSS